MMGAASSTGESRNENSDGSRIDLRIEGMTCASCVSRVESALRGVPGVETARVNLATETASVRTAAPVETEKLVRAVQSAGYDAVPAGRSGFDVPVERRQEQHLRERRQAVVTAVGIGLPIMALHYLAHLLSGTHAGAHFWPMLLQGLLTIMLLVSPAGGPILIGGIRGLLHRSPNMDLLIALGVLAATLGSFAALLIPRLEPINYFHDAAMILIFINVGKYLESRSRMRAGASLSALLKRAPRRAVREEGGEAREISVEQVRPGDRLRVAAESYVPVDGRVLSGRASLDLSMWTGESAPAEVEAGGEVLGGAYVYAGSMTVEATAIGADSAISRIARMVEEAQTGKTRMQALADRVAGIFVPIVVALAAITFLGWIVLSGNGAAAWSAMIAVLVVACPCAMGLATPTAVMVSTGSAALRGIIVRDPNALESTATCNVALLDKTGTITSGALTVSSIEPIGVRTPGAQENEQTKRAEIDEQELLRLAASAEQFSPHPLAKAIVEAARARGLKLSEPSDYDAAAGLGVRVAIDHHAVLVGSARYLNQSKVEIPPEPGHGAAGAMIGTEILVACDGILIGRITLHDVPRPEAARVIQRLAALGLRPMLVTGDQERVAAGVARAVGIDDVHAGMSPADKAKFVQQLQQEGRRVLMVGDGINDAPALAAADAAIAMAGGTQVAAETAAIALVGDRIELIPDAIELARQSVRIIRQNLFWAFAYNVVAIPLAMFLILPAAYAAAAMMFSSISVVLNSLRLQRFAPKHAMKPA